MGMMAGNQKAGSAAPEEHALAENIPNHEWLRKRQRIYWYDQYALNEQETAFANYDPDRIAAELKEGRTTISFPITRFSALTANASPILSRAEGNG